MKIMICELPETEMIYLKRNCEKEFADGKICVITQKQAQKLCQNKKNNNEQKKEGLNSSNSCTGENVIVSQNRAVLVDCAKAGMVTVAYQPHQNETISTAFLAGADNTEMIEDICTDMDRQRFLQADIIVEGFEEVDYDFLKKIYERHHGIPWTILETECLFVRELALSDLDALFELYAYEGMTDYMEGLYSYEEEYRYQKAYIENMYRFFGYGMWLVFEKETGKLVGRAGVEHREELEGELELGYAIGTPWQKKGYATEVCQAILSYVREQLGFEKVCSLVQPENLRSVHLLEKLGFVAEKDVVLDRITYKKYIKCY